MGKIRQLTQSKFARNVLIVASGTAMGQVLGVIFTPIITRLYGPDAYGLMGTFVSLSTMAASTSALTYPSAIVLPKKDDDARDIARLAVYVSLIIASVAAVLLWITGDRLFILIGAQAIAAYSMLIPIKMVFSAWLRVGQAWFIRKKRFKSTAKVEVSNSLFVNVCNVVIGLFKPLAAVLIVFHTMGIGLQVLMLYLSRGSDKKENDAQPAVRKTSMTGLAKKYYDFPLYRAPVVLIEDVSSNLPVLVLAALFGPASAGFYVLGFKLLKAPSKLIGRSVANVFFPKITQAAHKGKDIRSLIIKATLGLAGAGFLPYFLVFLFGPWIFKLVFGPEWIRAGEYARWISFNAFFQFIYRPSSVAIVTLGLQKEFLIYEVISTTFEVAVLYAGFIIFKSDLVAVALFSAAYAVSLFSLTSYVIYASKNSVRQERF